MAQYIVVDTYVTIKVTVDDYGKGADTMAVLAKPRTSAFMLDRSKSEQFFAQKEHTSEKALSRIMKHKAKADKQNKNEHRS